MAGESVEAPTGIDPLIRQAAAAAAVGNIPAALVVMADAVRRFPCNADGLACLAHLLAVAGREAESLERLGEAICIDPRHLTARLLRGHLLGRMGRHDEALADFGAVLQAQPANTGALSGQSSALAASGRATQALQVMDQLLSIEPDSLDWLHRRGSLLLLLQRYDQAAADFERLLAAGPAAVSARSEYGVTLYNLGRHPEAITQLDQALAADPEDVPALIARGLSAGQLERHEEALQFFDRALALEPANPEALVEKAVALGLLQRLQEALRSLEQAARIAPEHPEVLNALGATLAQLNRLDEALTCYDRSLTVKPDQPFARSDRALLLLALGDYPRGFAEFEVRWEIPPLSRLRLCSDAPAWSGREDLQGRTLLLHHEQGFGDTLQFVRYVPLLAARGAQVLLRVPDPLIRLFSGMRGITRLVSESAPLPQHDYHCPLMSLPAAMGTTCATVPATIPYLRADRIDVERWRSRLGPWTRPRIGLAWAGRNGSRIADRRDLPLQLLQPLLVHAAAAGAQFISLQKDVPDRDHPALEALRPLVMGTEEMVDFADTAGLMMNLDLVLSVDTAVAHLAASLARPLWLLNRFAPCWRWRNGSPWYPSVRQFRQSLSGDWSGVIAEVVQAFGPVLANGHNAQAPES